MEGARRTTRRKAERSEKLTRTRFSPQNRAEKLAKVYQPLRSALGTRSTVSAAHLLAARQDFSKILRTSSGKMREKTACAINKVGSDGSLGQLAPLQFYHLFCPPSGSDGQSPGPGRTTL